MNVIGIDKLVKKVSLGRSTIYRLISEGKFPKPFQAVPNRNAWIETDIDLWLKAKVNPELENEHVAATTSAAPLFDSILDEAIMWENIGRCRRYLEHIENVARERKLPAAARDAIAHQIRSLRLLCDELDPTDGRVTTMRR